MPQIKILNALEPLSAALECLVNDWLRFNTVLRVLQINTNIAHWTASHLKGGGLTGPGESSETLLVVPDEMDG